MTDRFSDFHYRTTDGLTLHARIYGNNPKSDPPVVCLPGLTRNVRDFHDLALFLSTRSETPRKVICLDYRGRGGSDHDPDWKHYNIAVEARDVISGLESLGIEEAAFIGTSRGGLIVHLLAALRPEILKCVVLNDIGPVLQAEGLRHIRTYLTQPVNADTFEEAATNQRAIHGASFPALSDADWKRMVGAIYRNDNGRPVADFDPALVKVVEALDLDAPIPMLWQQFDALRSVPMLVIRGENSKLLSAVTVDQMRSRHPGLDSITVAGQGHPPMLETAGLPEQIAGFLDSRL